MVRISKVLRVADNICDCIPVVSVINNLVDLVAKAIFKAANVDIEQSNKWTRHVSDKPVSRCFLYMIPFYGLMTKVFCRPKSDYVIME